MEDYSERNNSLNWTILSGWIKKAKNPVQVIGLVTIYVIGTYKNIIPLNIIPITFCFFMAFCILCRNNINTWVKDWRKVKEHEFDQKTQRYIEKQKTKRHIEKQKSKRAKYEYLKTLEKEREKKQTDSLNQNDDDPSCKIYEIKRRGS